MFFQKAEYLASNYKSSDLSYKLPKMTKCIYKEIYFILSINFLIIIIIIITLC